MSSAELIERLTDLVKLQADIIHEQATALAQFGTVAGLEEKMEAAALERATIIREGRESAPPSL